MSAPNRRTNKKGDGFYWSPAWRKLRMQALLRDRYRCVVCGTSVCKPGQARVDHIRTRRDAPDLALSLDNIRVLCTTCDAQAHSEKGSGAGTREQRFKYGYDSNGVPIDPAHMWNNR